MANEFNILLKNVQRVRANLNEYILDAAIQESDKLSDINRDQLTKGVLSSGDRTEEYASLSYINDKVSIGSISVPNMDFKLTGSFHEGINVNKEGFNSTDSKADYLIANWGEDILGIAPSNEQKAADTIDPILTKRIDNEIIKGIK